MSGSSPSWSSLAPGTGATPTTPPPQEEEEEDAGSRVEPSPHPCLEPIGAEMSCRKRCKREIFKFAQYLFRLVTGTLNTGKVDVLLPRRWGWGALQL